MTEWKDKFYVIKKTILFTGTTPDISKSYGKILSIE